MTELCQHTRRGFVAVAMLGWLGACNAANTAGGGGAGGAEITVPSTCVGTPVVTAKRVVRLTEHQLFAAYGTLFGATVTATLAQNEAVPSLLDREFPPISGDLAISDGLLGKADRLAQAAMDYVGRNARSLTACGAVPSDKACVIDFLLSFAERAFRHPLSDDEQLSLTGQFWSELTAAGATVAEALGYGVYAVLTSPSFLYRTELGADASSDGPLTPYELASTVSLFLTDGPPDAELLAAAAADALAQPDQLRQQAERLLATPAARANLEAALIKYFALTNAPTVILNPEVTPGLSLTSGLQASIFHEGELFLRNTLWSAPLRELLTTRRTWTSPAIATSIYGVGPPAELDADGFGAVTLPEDRAGLLTLSPFLLAGARSTGGSPVARGLAINRSIVCEVNPPFPQVTDPSTGQLAPDPEVAAAIAALADESEQQKAAYRASTARCAGCHTRFDPFGLVLEPYDAVGRRRDSDLAGRPIDASWTTTTLPASVGGARVTSAAEAARALAQSGALDRCLAMNFINYALTEVSRGGANNTELAAAPQTATCAVQGVLEAWASTDLTFASLMREIAASPTLAQRAAGR